MDEIHFSTNSSLASILAVVNDFLESVTSSLVLIVTGHKAFTLSCFILGARFFASLRCSFSSHFLCLSGSSSWRILSFSALRRSSRLCAAASALAACVVFRKASSTLSLFLSALFLLYITVEFYQHYNTF